MTGVHDGHRKRLRERFREEGLEGFAPHEVLELLLFYGRARGDVNGLAHELLTRFGSLRGVLEAGPQQLMAVPGLGEETATLISLAVPLFRRYQLCLCEERPRIRTAAEAQAYCAALLSGLRVERFCLISLSADGRVLGTRVIAEGTPSEVSAWPRQVAEAALNHSAHSVLLTHNHPGGGCEPSRADTETTALIRRVLAGLDITLLDHIIVAEGRTCSMAALGLIGQEASGADRTGPRKAQPDRGKA